MNEYYPEIQRPEADSTSLASRSEQGIKSYLSIEDEHIDTLIQISSTELTFPKGRIPNLAVKGIILDIPDTREVKDGLLKVYLLYTINVSIKDTNGHLKEFRTHRRYSDFDWLFENLCNKYSGYVVPILPAKSILKTVGKQDQEFVETRKKDLIVFLTKCIQHPFLRNTVEFKIFLSDDNGFAELKKREQASKLTKGLQFLSKIMNGDSADTIFESEELDDVDTDLLTYKLSFESRREVLEKFSKRLADYLRTNKRQLAASRPFMRELENTLTMALTYLPSSAKFEKIFRRLSKSKESQLSMDLAKDINLELDRHLKSIFNSIDSAQLAIRGRNIMAKQFDKMKLILDEKKEIRQKDKEYYVMKEQFKKLKEIFNSSTDILLDDLEMFDQDLESEMGFFFNNFSQLMKHYREELAQEAQSLIEDRHPMKSSRYFESQVSSV